MKLDKKLSESPQLKQRLLSAIQAGGSEIAKVFNDNPFVSIPWEIVRAWFETGNQ
jgi:hypothetical protein